MSADVTADDNRRLIVLAEAAEIFDIPKSTLRRLCATGRVPAEKVGRGWRVKRGYLDQVTAWPAEEAS